MGRIFLAVFFWNYSTYTFSGIWHRQRRAFVYQIRDL